MFSNNSSTPSGERGGGDGDSVEKSFDPVLVYCRIRPLPSVGDINNVAIRNQNTVALISMGSGTHYKHQPADYETRYVFKQVFGPNTDQSDVYQVVAQPLVEKLIKGSSSLLFTYGVTGSGKTYTMTGDSKELGVMPRCLEALFRTISGFHACRCIFQPDHLNSFEVISETEAHVRQKRIQRTVTSTRSTLRLKSSDTELNLSSLQRTAPLPGVDERNVYSVFISYTEVYNNCVYDLLEEGSIQKTLQNRIVREDANHNMYVHGVTELEINSVQEAMDAFEIGQKRKRIGHTVLNAESSRSHSVFNIRLVQAPIGQHAREDKKMITVSQLSLVDLAGSERSARTKNTGARLREAGNINNSLMTLRTCLEYLRENQQSPVGTIPKKVPYRDSKITHLFKSFFEGEGQVSMIACINPSSDDLIENSNVMKFAEITQELQVARAATVQLANNDNDLLKLLSLKFGCKVEGPIGDGPLSEKLINIFQQQLEKNRNVVAIKEELCEEYRNTIADLEQQNSELQILYEKACNRNRLMEITHKKSIKHLQEKLKDQDGRLKFLEQKMDVEKRMKHWKDNEDYQSLKSISDERNEKSPRLRRVKSLCNLSQFSTSSEKSRCRSKSAGEKSRPSSDLRMEENNEKLSRNQKMNEGTEPRHRSASKIIPLINFQLLQKYIDFERHQDS